MGRGACRPDSNTAAPQANDSFVSPELDLGAVLSRIRALGPGERPLALLTTGGFCPVHRAHIAAHVHAAEALRREHGLAVVQSFLSPSHDSYVCGESGKMALSGRAGYELPSELRADLIDLAAAQWDWIRASRWEGRQATQVSSGAVLDHLAESVARAAVAEGLESLPLIGALVGGDMANLYKSYRDSGRVLVVCVRPGSTPLIDEASADYDPEFARIAESRTAQSEAGVYVMFAEPSDCVSSSALHEAFVATASAPGQARLAALLPFCTGEPHAQWLLERWGPSAAGGPSSAPGAAAKDCVLFPEGYFHSAAWGAVVEALAQISSASNASELWAAVATVSHDPRCAGGAADDDFEPVLDAVQSAAGGHFEGLFSDTVPAMSALVARAPELFSEAVPLLRAGEAGALALSRDMVATLLAMAALGVGLPEAAYRRGCVDGGTFPFPSMLPLIWPKRGCDFPPNVEKVKCFMHYFRRVSEESAAADGRPVVFQRVVAGESAADMDMEASTAPLCKLEVQPLRTSIDDQQGCVRVDFANAQIGGGAFLNTPGSTAQEEITFVTHPELCAAKLVCEEMAAGDALLLSGARRFADHAGYLASFRFAGPAAAGGDGAPPCPDTAWLAIDALRYPDQAARAQFVDTGTRRDLRKALTGFRCVAGHRRWGAVATGSWGCGAFNGDPEVKAVLQLAAASHAGIAELRYHTWDDEVIAEALVALAAAAQGRTAGELWAAAGAAAAGNAPIVKGDFLAAVALALSP